MSTTDANTSSDNQGPFSFQLFQAWARGEARLSTIDSGEAVLLGAGT